MTDCASLYRQVRAAIAKKAGCTVGEIRCRDAIADHLTDVQMRNLAPLFQTIARSYHPKAVISEVESAALDDVLSAYNLVGTRVGCSVIDCGHLPWCRGRGDGG